MWPTLKRLSLGMALIAAASAVLLLSDVDRRQSGGKQPPRIALLQHASQPALDDGVAGMLDGLAESGFVDGTTMSLRRYNAENDLATANTIAKALTGGEYDVVLTASTISMQAVANANRDGRVVHVFGLVTDPFGAGVGISRENPLAHPRHLVGYGTMQPIAEAFRLARRMSPELTTVGVAWNPAESNSEAQLKVARPAAHELGIELLEATVENTSGVGEAASSLVSRGARALWVPGDVMVLAAIDTIVAVARRAHIPVFTSIPGNAPRGTLFDLGANYHEVGRVAGALAAQILHGTDPATVPVTNVVPERLVVNEQALADLRDPWRLPDEVRQRAELVGAAPGAAAAQATSARASGASAPLAKRWRVDVLQYINIPEVEDAEHGIRAGLVDAGLVADRDFVVTVRNAQGDMPTLNTLVDAALSDGTDLLMPLSTPALQATLQRARGRPIVFSVIANPFLAGAGRTNEDHLPNVTGVPTVGAYDPLLAVLRECVPNAHRIGTLFVPAEVNSVFNKDQLTQAAQNSGMELRVVAVNTSTEVADAALALATQGIDAIAQIGGSLTAASFTAIAQAARRARVPLFGVLSSNIHEGAAVVLSRDYYDGGHAAGLIAARVIRGEPPAAIPFEPLQKTRLLVNPAAAGALGMTIPRSLVARADEVVEK
ncbi:MAG: hypothetical protein E6J72_07535 [Deltaproteobacteria bacterium]|nr:MAG: hypothetical protein E6J72_07535 [Deltaproteobacteria bacterium]